MSNYNKLLNECPGACGELARAFNQAHESDQPGMALAAAISTMATIRAGKVSYKEVEASTYFCIMGDSGCGKTRMMGRAKKALVEAGVDILRLHPPASGVALFNRVAAGERLLMWDEFGEVLKQVIGGQQGFVSDITRRIKILFNEHYNVLGNSYADSKLRPAVDIAEGFLVFLGASTPEHMQDVLECDFIRDGLLPRLLLIESEPLGAMREEPLVVPRSFTRQVERYWVSASGDIAQSLGQFQYTPKQELILEPAAQKELLRYKLDTQIERREERDKLKLVMFNRKLEHCTKILLAISDNGRADIEHVRFAREFVETVLQRQVEICLNDLGRNKYTVLKDTLLEIIPKDTWLSGSDIYQKTRGIDRQMRKSCLEDLKDAEQIYERLGKRAKGAGRPVSEYTRSRKLYNEYLDQAEKSSGQDYYQ